MPTPQGKKILWAIDAFAEDEVLDRKTAHILKAWVKESHPSIEPVTVLSPDQLKLPPAFFADRSEDVMEHVTSNLKKRLGGLDVAGLTEPKVLLSIDVSLRNAVDRIVAHAKKSGAELIVISSHSQKTVSHFLFGSFAETLVLQSEIPVFIVTPRMHEIRRVENILFPTDLSAVAHKAMEEIIPIAKAWGANLILYHKVDYLATFSLPNFEAGSAYAEYFEEDIERRKKLLEQWAGEARGAGARVQTRMDEASGQAVWESIIHQANHYSGGIIAMASQTGPVFSAILGSTTRQVIRQASCPLWIIHPQGGR